MAAYANLGGLGGLGGMGGVEPEQKPSFLRSDGFGNVLQALGTSLLSSPRNAPLSGFGSALQGFSQNSLEQRKEAEQRAAFEQALIASGMDPAQAKMMAASPQAAKFAMDQQETSKTKNTTRNWLLGQGFSETDADAAVANPAILSNIMKQMKGGGGEEYGLNPQYGVDPNGNPVLIQLGKGGTSIQTPLPEGVTLSKEPIKLDAKTHWVLLDPITRQQIGIIPKETYEEAAQSASGSAAGKAQAEAGIALPGAADLAANISKQVDGLKNDPYLKDMLGPLNSRLPNVTSDAARVQGKMDQIAGGAFLQGREMLKGGGAITDFESTKAEAAFVRMNAAQNEADFKMALDEFNDAVQQGVRKLEAQARGQSSTGGAPSTGASPYKDRYGLE